MHQSFTCVLFMQWMHNKEKYILLRFTFSFAKCSFTKISHKISRHQSRIIHSTACHVINEKWTDAHGTAWRWKCRGTQILVCHFSAKNRQNTMSWTWHDKQIKCLSFHYIKFQWNNVIQLFRYKRTHLSPYIPCFKYLSFKGTIISHS